VSGEGGDGVSSLAGFQSGRCWRGRSAGLAVRADGGFRVPTLHPDRRQTGLSV